MKKNADNYRSQIKEDMLDGMTDSPLYKDKIKKMAKLSEDYKREQNLGAGIIAWEDQVVIEQIAKEAGKFSSGSELGAEPELVLSEDAQKVQKASEMAEQYLEKSIDKLKFAAEAAELDKYAKELGIEGYTKGINKKVIINFLAVYGIWNLFKLVKGKGLKIAIGGVGAVLLLKNKDAVMGLIKGEEVISAKTTIVNNKAPSLAALPPSKTAHEVSYKVLEK